MKNVAIAVLMSVASFSASADVITFETPGAFDFDSTVGTSYEVGATPGLAFGNFVIMKPLATTTGYYNNLVSGAHLAYGRVGVINSITSTSGDSFTLNDAWLGAAWNNGLSIEIKGFVGGIEQYSKTVVVNTTGASLIAFDWVVDSLTFTSSGGVHAGSGLGAGVHFTLDDLRVNVAAVPEPSSYAMLALGLGVLGFAARKKAA